MHTVGRAETGAVWPADRPTFWLLICHWMALVGWLAAALGGTSKQPLTDAKAALHVQRSVWAIA